MVIMGNESSLAFQTFYYDAQKIHCLIVLDPIANATSARILSVVVIELNAFNSCEFQ